VRRDFYPSWGSGLSIGCNNVLGHLGSIPVARMLNISKNGDNTAEWNADRIRVVLVPQYALHKLGLTNYVKFDALSTSRQYLWLSRTAVDMQYK
jgi:hypothetical protein